MGQRLKYENYRYETIKFLKHRGKLSQPWQGFLDTKLKAQATEKKKKEKVDLDFSKVKHFLFQGHILARIHLDEGTCHYIVLIALN